mgnify:CR=1 FL=1
MERGNQRLAADTNILRASWAGFPSAAKARIKQERQVLQLLVH